MLIANKVLGAKMLAVDEAGDVEGGDRLSDALKRVELKTGRSES